MTNKTELAEGAHNLLVNCAGLSPSDRVLIVHEDPALGWYDLDAPLAVKQEAERLGATVTLLQVGAPTNQPNNLVSRQIADNDLIIFFARIGDQDRFADPIPGKTCVMSYARTADALASPYGRTDHRAFVALKGAVDRVLANANAISLHCPLGTDLTGDVQPSEVPGLGDVRFHRFPLGVPTPVSAATFSGKVALSGYLTPTGSKVYDPASVGLDETIMAHIGNGRLSAFKGDARAVEQAEDHYRRVAQTFGIDASAVHSWHAGIHPGCSYPLAIADDPDRWSNTVFTHPRYLHFHTCGTYAPGEICWMVRDPTITVDGRNLWQDGELMVGAFEPVAECMTDWPELADLFEREPGATGV